MDRFFRSRLLIGKDKFKKLHKSKVTVVGLGAVGGYAVEALARAGVGYLRLVDFDRVDITNINRQLYALESTIGMSKAELARQRVLDINPKIKLEIMDMFSDKHTNDIILDNNPDLVIDAIDSLTPKVQFIAEAYNRGIPIISSMGAALKTDPSAIRVGDLFHTRGCRLARFVRKRLRRQGITDGIKCVFSHEERNADAIVDPDEKTVVSRGRKRNVMGSLPTVTGIFGLTIAHYAIEQLIDGF